MDNINKVMQTINIGMYVAQFLLNTSRVLKAIELGKECLILINSIAPYMTQTSVKLLYSSAYSLIFNGYALINDYTSAIQWGRKHIVLLRESGDRDKEGKVTIHLAALYERQCKYTEATELYKKALSIMISTGERRLEQVCYGKLGIMCHSIGEYARAEEFLQQALQISKEIGDKNGEAAVYSNLGGVFQSLGEYVKAEQHFRKGLNIMKELDNKIGEALCYGNLGILCMSRGKYDKAEEILERTLKIRQAIGDKEGEATDLSNLGTVFKSRGEYVKAEEFLQKSLQITNEIGNKKVEAKVYGNLGTLFYSLHDYVKAKEFYQQALDISTEFGDKQVKASCYGNLGTVFQSLSEYIKAKEHHQKALAIHKEIGDKEGEASCYGNLGTVFCALHEYDKAKNFIQKALQMSIQIGNQQVEAHCYGKLGTVFGYVCEYSKAKKFHEKALELSYKIGDIELRFDSHLNLTLDALCLKENVDEAVSNLVESMKTSEEIRFFLRDNDQFKISFLDTQTCSYQILSLLFCVTGKHYEALHVVELGRARALADLMSVRYRVETQISVDQESWVGIEKIIKESGHVCLYISYFHRFLFLWVIKRNKVILFKLMGINDRFGNKEGEDKVNEVFGDVTFRKFPRLSQGQYEDRSLSPSNITHLTCESSHECSQEDARSIVTEDDDENQFHEPPSLSECYKIIITPVADLLDEPEIIIVPDRILYKVPFAAFKDESGKYLSESFRLRTVPSLITLKLIQDSPADYHSQTGALIVGDPQVGHVTYKGHRKWISPLSCAKKEAEMIGRLLGVQPLLGEHATKQAVLQSIHSVGLIHFAAHGDAERGEIALAPPRPFNGTPQEQDYLLTMAEISQVRLTAKLVVLSCCHSADGQIRSEGVVGIARAFLGSGARSVLVALWAIQDKATEQFMSRFYEHLVGGESASESLHQAMKWMRANGFSDVEQWAPFMLIGDDVTFDFGK